MLKAKGRGRAELKGRHQPALEALGVLAEGAERLPTGCWFSLVHQSGGGVSVLLPPSRLLAGMLRITYRRSEKSIQSVERERETNSHNRPCRRGRRLTDTKQSVPAKVLGISRYSSGKSLCHVPGTSAKKIPGARKGARGPASTRRVNGAHVAIRLRLQDGFAPAQGPRPCTAPSNHLGRVKSLYKAALPLSQGMDPVGSCRAPCAATPLPARVSPQKKKNG